MIESVKTAVAIVVFWFGYYWYKAFNRTPRYSYLSLRKLFYTSNTEFNKRVSAKIAKENSDYQNIIPTGILGSFTKDDLKNIGDRIQQDGYYIFSESLNSSTIEELIHLSFRTKATLIPKPASANEHEFFDRTSPRTIKLSIL